MSDEDIQKMSSFELAVHLDSMDGDLDEKAQRVGKRIRFVRELLDTLRGSRPALRRAWKEGKIPLYLVKQLATKQGTDQSNAVAKYLRATQGRTRAARVDAARDVLKKGQ